jgi:hypothetical protein
MIWNSCGSCNSPFISIGFWYENEKHKSMSPRAMQVKNQQKKISIEDKLDVICQLGKGERNVDKCRNVSFA